MLTRVRETGRRLTTGCQLATSPPGIAAILPSPSPATIAQGQGRPDCLQSALRHGDRVVRRGQELQITEWG